MAKGIAIKFQSYKETIPKLFSVIKLDKELAKHDKIVLKPFVQRSDLAHTSVEFVEAVLEYCKAHKNPVAEIFIAEGSDGEDTISLFEEYGYRALAEKHSVGLIDLNNAELEEVIDDEFLKFDQIYLPKILKESFVISLPKLVEDEELEMISSLSNMIGAYPSSNYSGFFSSKKSKIRKWPMKYSIHDIVKAKMPNLAVVDASEKGYILTGQPIEIDKQSAKILGFEWKDISFLRLLTETFPEEEKDQ